MQDAAVVADLPLAIAESVAAIVRTHFARVPLGPPGLVGQDVLVIAAGSVIADEVPPGVAPLDDVGTPGGFAADAGSVRPNDLFGRDAVL